MIVASLRTNTCSHRLPTERARDAVQRCSRGPGSARARRAARVRMSAWALGYAAAMSRPGPAGRRHLLDRVLGGRRARSPNAVAPPPLPRPRARGRFGFWGPVPHYTTRTRRGSDVSVGGCGCCLPIPLIGGLGAAAGLRALRRRVR